MARPYTPELLAECWDCSAETVRAMVRSGTLPAFRVGKMMRITARAVEDYECGITGSDDSRAGSSSCGTTTEEAGDVIALRHTRRKMLSAKRAT